MIEISQSKFPANLPKGWHSHLYDEKNLDYFKNLKFFLRKQIKDKKTIFPPSKQILRALQLLDYKDVKVVVLGQDPYHGPGQAIGLSFAVPNTLRVKPPSLVNIFKEIESDLGKKVDRTQSELNHWVREGVLLLNTVLTVQMGQAFSHREKGWETFTSRVIEKLNLRKDPVIFILWGTSARKKKMIIDINRHFIIESAHPSPLSAYGGFFGSRPFSNTNAILKKLGKAPIHWEVTS